MGTKLDHEAVLSLLSNGDVASYELYYHGKCYDTIRYQYSEFTKSKSDKSLGMRKTECKQIALHKVLFYLRCLMTAKCLIQGNLYL